MRQAQPLDLRVHVSSAARRHHQPRQHGLGATEEQRRTDSARERQPWPPAATAPRPPRGRSARRRSDVDVWAACRRLTGNPGLAQLIPDMPDRRFGVRIEHQLDGMHHGHTRLATHAASNADALIDSNSVAVSAPAPPGSTARTGASAAQCLAIALLGRARLAAATHRSPARRTESLGKQALPMSTRCGSTCPAPQRRRPAPARPDQPRRRAASRRRRRARRADRPPPPPASAVAPRSLTSRTDATSSTRVGNGMPARCAAAAGASGSGYRHGPRSSVTPDSRPDIGEVVVAGAAGLHGFAHSDVDAGQPRVTGQRRGRHRLADAGVGARDDENGHCDRMSAAGRSGLPTALR